jgi:hypothetical protein
VSEGTPGRGPDADSRTEAGDGKAPTNGRPTVPPVRYGPRNGSPSSGPNGRGAAGRTESGTNGAGTNGSVSNGSGSNGSRPSSYTRPRPSNVPARPEPSEQERLVADARTAAAARNSSAAKVRGGSALSGTRPPAPVEPKSSPAEPAAPVDETAVIPAVTAEETAVVTPTETTETTQPSTPTSDETAAPEKGRGRFARLRTRDRRPADDAAAPSMTPESAAAAVEAPTAKSGDVETATEPAETSAEPEPGTEPTAVPAVDSTTEQDSATAERPLTWRDRLGLSPKEPKPQGVDAPGTDVAATTTTAAEATDAAVVTAETETAPVQDRVSPSPFAPATTSDTVVIPAVETGAPVPVAGATALPVVAPAAPKPKVGAARRTRKARLRLSRVDPWSVMKTALLFSIAAGIILVVATYGVWSVLNASGLFAAVNDMVKSVVSTPGDTTPFRIEDYVNTQKIIGVAALIAVVDVLIFTALATLGSFLYNLAATVLGGLEVTLAED